MSDFVTGSYKNKKDEKQKFDAKKKLLELSKSLRKKEADAFKRKLKEGDVPQPARLDEQPKYASVADELQDRQEQAQRALTNARTLLPRGAEASNFVSSMSSESTDPLDSSLGALPLFTLFNKYFLQFKDKVSSIKLLTAPVLKTYFLEFLDGLEEDLLPKTNLIASISGTIDKLKTADPGNPIYDDFARIVVSNERIPLTESQLQDFNRILFLNPSENTVKNLLERLLKTKPALAGPLPSASLARIAARGAAPDLTDADDIKDFITRDIIKFTVPQLNNIFKDAGITGITKLSKAQKINRIRDELDAGGARSATMIGAIEASPKFISLYTLASGSGLKKRTQKKLMIGKGIDVKPEEDDVYIKLGKLQMSKPKFRSGIISLYKVGSYSRPNNMVLRKNITVSENMKKFLSDFIKTQSIDNKLYYKLTGNEKNLIQKILKDAGLMHVFDEADVELEDGYISDSDEKLVDAFDLISGQIQAGQNSDKVIKDLKVCSEKLYKRGLMTVTQYNKILREL